MRKEKGRNKYSLEFDLRRDRTFSFFETQKFVHKRQARSSALYYRVKCPEKSDRPCTAPWGYTRFENALAAKIWGYTRYGAIHGSLQYTTLVVILKVKAKLGNFS